MLLYPHRLTKNLIISNIKEPGIIGSYARGEQTEDSDLDIMVDFNKPTGWEVVDLRDDLEKLLGLNVDLILKAGIKQRKKVFDGIKEDAVYIK
ncbi:nucleotidyltransferase family protein [Methanolacinia paynteri]|uniref:nucleotidyltransferase family protein n=1 Tax=Methanolacinia paynteri TaxID=230356 RepID=UPI00064ECCC3|nr:nucleotidyltransferase family protein [Methanolacinia paynteri]